MRGKSTAHRILRSCLASKRLRWRTRTFGSLSIRSCLRRSTDSPQAAHVDRPPSVSAHVNLARQSSNRSAAEAACDGGRAPFLLAAADTWWCTSPRASERSRKGSRVDEVDPHRAQTTSDRRAPQKTSCTNVGRAAGDAEPSGEPRAAADASAAAAASGPSDEHVSGDGVSAPSEDGTTDAGTTGGKMDGSVTDVGRASGTTDVGTISGAAGCVAGASARASDTCEARPCSSVMRNSWASCCS
mmetsp:Transcript_14942/g.51974  ORF Transcript_14942/g.51974 Transcript_14942/m.51974 type:complete len:243 (-) Transcript_14942:570-1298(-)